MIKKASSKAKAVAKPVTEKKPVVKAETANVAKPASGKGDLTTFSADAKDQKVKNMPNLEAMFDSPAGKDEEKSKVGKDEKAEAGDKTEAGEKTEKPEEKKYPPEVQQKIDTLEAQLKDAEKRGDKETIERLQKELEKLKNPTPAPGTEGENTTPPVGAADGSGNAAGGGTPAGGGSPAGGGNPSGGGTPETGGAPAGGSSPSGGNSPAGGSAPSDSGSQVGGANEANAGQQASEQEVNQFIQFAAQAYGVNPTLLSEIARRESNFNTGDIANNWDSNAKKGTPSKGMFQFIQPTFQSMMPKAKEANPQAWQGVSENWTDWKAQALTCAWAISDGKGSHWSTYKSALGTAGGNPSGPRAN